MNLAIDHFVWGAPDLDYGNTVIEEAFGVSPMFGGSHPGIGTRNALLSLGSQTYLEIIAPDKGKLPVNSLGEKLKQLTSPGLMTWVNRCDQLPNLAKSAANSTSNLTPVGPVKTQRETAEKQLLEWELLFIVQHQYGGLLPFFIDWKRSPHPSLSAPSGGEFQEVRLCSPHAALLNQALNELDVSTHATQANQAAIEVDITALNGNITLASTAETLQLSFI